MKRKEQPLRWREVAQAVRQLAAARRVVYRTEVDSTMEVCHALARAGAEPGVVVVADAQTAGRGRQGRAWLAPPSTCLLFSILLCPAMARDRWLHVMWPLSLALQEAIERETGLRAGIKWPNDLVARGKKLGGLLAETTTQGVVVGAGLNVNFSAATLSLDRPLTTLADELGSAISREALLTACLQSFDEWYSRWQAAPDEVWQAWRASASLIGQEVQVAVGDAAHSGTVVDQDRDGCLCVRTARDVVLRFAAGDAHVQAGNSE